MEIFVSKFILKEKYLRFKKTRIDVRAQKTLCKNSYFVNYSHTSETTLGITYYIAISMVCKQRIYFVVFAIN